MPNSSEKKKKHPGLQLVAGGSAGLVESSICHPLDTIKTRMQLRRQQSTIEAVRARSSLHEPGLTRSMSSMSSFAEPKLTHLHSSTGEPSGIRAAVNSIMGRSSSMQITNRSPVQATLGPSWYCSSHYSKGRFLKFVQGPYCCILWNHPQNGHSFLEFRAI